MKKLFCLALALILALCVPCFGAAAEEEEEREIFTCGDYKYALLDDGSAEITYYFDEGDIDSLVIPDTLDGHPVTAIGDYAFISDVF